MPRPKPPASLAGKTASAAPVGLCALDAQGRVRWANTAAAALLGRDAKELVGLDLHEVLPHGHDEASCPLLAGGEAEITLGEGTVFCRSAASGTGHAVTLQRGPADSAALRAELHRARNMLGAILLNVGLSTDPERAAEQRERARGRMKRNIDDLSALLETIPKIVRG
jgi:hypothetical protein